MKARREWVRKDQGLPSVDDIIVIAAYKYMREFDIEEFKKTHRSLYLVIKDSCQRYGLEIFKILNYETPKRHHTSSAEGKTEDQI
jgi:hypothetical protein